MIICGKILSLLAKEKYAGYVFKGKTEANNNIDGKIDTKDQIFR